mgnify:CR=1 FL=1
MNIGVPKEIKNNEYRVAITPAGVREFVKHGHTVFIENSAGLGSAISDDDYRAVGATILSSADEVWAKSDLVLKVKEPIAAEYSRMRSGQVLFTYLHLAASRECTDALIKSGITAIAYETVEVNGALPLLAPMSEVAGRMAAQVGAAALQKSAGGRGVLLGGVPGVRPGRVLVLGGGTAGLAAATIAQGMRADVTIVDVNQKRLGEIDQIFNGTVKTLMSNTHEIEEQALNADLVIGAVLVHGAKAPKLITNELVKKMKPGAVLVDIAIDQGGCVEGVQATSHTDPVQSMGHVRVSATPNMPAAVPRTSTTALTAATLPYIRALAAGWTHAVTVHPELIGAVNVQSGEIVHPAIREELAKR